MTTVTFGNMPMSYLDEIAHRYKMAGSPKGLVIFAPEGYGVVYNNWSDAEKAFNAITVKGRSCLCWQMENGFITISMEKLIE